MERFEKPEKKVTLTPQQSKAEKKKKTSNTKMCPTFDHKQHENRQICNTWGVGPAPRGWGPTRGGRGSGMSLHKRNGGRRAEWTLPKELTFLFSFYFASNPNNCRFEKVAHVVKLNKSEVQSNVGFSETFSVLSPNIKKVCGL